jgi:hypothetical protein
MFSRPNLADKYPDGVLRFQIDENPNPRDTGTLYVSCGKHVIFSLNVTLDLAGVEASCMELTQRIEQVRKSTFQEMKFINVAPWASKKIENHLTALGITPTTSTAPTSLEMRP